MTLAVFSIFLLSLSFSQVISGTSTESSNNRVNEFLSVAEAVKAVELAGGPRKILEDHQYKKLPPHIQEILHGLVKIEEEQRKTSDEKVAPRFFGGLIKMGVTALFRAYMDLNKPKVTTVDPEMQF